jgi:hypothetical protein
MTGSCSTAPKFNRLQIPIKQAWHCLKKSDVKRETEAVRRLSSRLQDFIFDQNPDELLRAALMKYPDIMISPAHGKRKRLEPLCQALLHRLPDDSARAALLTHASSEARLTSRGVVSAGGMGGSGGHCVRPGLGAG